MEAGGSLPHVMPKPWFETVSEVRRLQHQKQRGSCKEPPLDITSLASRLHACGKNKALFQGKSIHDYIILNGFERNRFLGNHLIQMYGCCAALQEAKDVFDKIDHPNLYSWSLIISAYTQHGRLKEALQLFEKMPKKDVISATAIIMCYAKQGRVKEAFEIFKQMPQRDVVSWTAMTTAYAQCGQLENAVQLFKQMPQRNVVSWNTLIAAHVQKGQLKEALELFKEMPRRNVVSWNSLIAGYIQHEQLREAFHIFQVMPYRDVVSWNAIISALSQHGKLEEALQLFKQMPERDLISWTAIIEACARHGHGRDALRLFQEMLLGGIRADHVTFASILVACNHNALLDDGCHYFVIMSQEFCMKPILEHYSCIVELVAHAGWLKAAEDLINHLPFQPDATIWKGLLSNCKTHVGSVQQHLY